MLETKETKNVAEKAAKIPVAAASAVSAILGIDDILKSKGIAQCNAKDNYINISGGYNGGFYIVKKLLPNRKFGKNICFECAYC